MTNVFRDQHAFMRACDQTVDQYNPDQYKLYVDLIDEEFKELKDAIEKRTASYRDSPSIIPPAIVAPARENPGKRANA